MSSPHAPPHIIRKQHIISGGRVYGELKFIRLKAKFWSILLYPQLNYKIKCPLKGRGSPHCMGNPEMKQVQWKKHWSHMREPQVSELLPLPTVQTPYLWVLVSSPVKRGHWTSWFLRSISVLQFEEMQRLQIAFMSHCETYLYSFHITQVCETQ